MKEAWWMRSYGDNNKRNKDWGEPHIQQFQEQVRPNPGVDCISLWPAGSTLHSATFIQWWNFNMLGKIVYNHSTCVHVILLCTNDLICYTETCVVTEQTIPSSVEQYRSNNVYSFNQILWYITKKCDIIGNLGNGERRKWKSTKS